MGCSGQGLACSNTFAFPCCLFHCCIVSTGSLFFLQELFLTGSSSSSILPPFLPPWTNSIAGFRFWLSNSFLFLWIFWVLLIVCRFPREISVVKASFNIWFSFFPNLIQDWKLPWCFSGLEFELYQVVKNQLCSHLHQIKNKSMNFVHPTWMRRSLPGP